MIGEIMGHPVNDSTDAGWSAWLVERYREGKGRSAENISEALADMSKALFDVVTHGEV